MKDNVIGWQASGQAGAVAAGERGAERTAVEQAVLDEYNQPRLF